ncbi:MAG: DUF3179 domain-containing protein [Candidatus Promineifilaceae bacterium]|nr:DUF3179 domain-containing protein [Candidatus Promineifilaceae bacterium]
MRRIHSSYWAALLALTLFLAACGSAPDSAAPVTATQPPVATATVAPATPTPTPATATPEPTGLASQSTTAPAPAEGAETGFDPTADEAGFQAIIDSVSDDLLERALTEWNTNWERRTIELSELKPLLPRDTIRSLDQPTFETTAEAAAWLSDEEPLITVELNGEARAYPLFIMAVHEIVNDQFGDRPVVITYCPLCNSAIVFEARLNGQTLEFGTSGMLRNADLIMYDRTTESLWQQFTGDAIVGDLTGERLTFLPSAIVSFADFRSAFPDGKILSRDTGFDYDYATRAGGYAGYDDLDNRPTLFPGRVDSRLPAMERVVSLTIDEAAMAYPLSVLARRGVIHDTVNGRDLVVFHTSGTSNSFFNPVSNEWQDVGATGVFDPTLDGRELTFVKDGQTIVDEQTGTHWNILGQAVTGPLSGEELTEIIHGNHFWFSWAAFHPDTDVFGQ